jgi:hypothetical protein
VRAALAAGDGSLAGALACYGPYVAWTSARLHRFAPLPSVEYVRDTRYVTDRFGLREMTPFIPWEERAMFLLTEDGQDRVLDGTSDAGHAGGARGGDGAGPRTAGRSILRSSRTGCGA